MNLKLPGFLKDLTDVIEVASISDDLKKQYLDLIETGEVTEENLQLLKDLVLLINTEIEKREKEILLSGDSQMIDQLRKNKSALYDWQNEVEELALTEAEQLAGKVDEDSFVKAGLTEEEQGSETPTSLATDNAQEETQDNSELPLSGGMI